MNELIKAVRLPAHQFGRTYVVEEFDLKLVEDRKPGRPPKPKDEKAKASKVGKKKGDKK